jgi:hypothetical protein
MTAFRGSTLMTGFPALAWQYPQFAGGVVVTKSARTLARAGIGADQLITALGEQRVVDAGLFARRFDELAQTQEKIQVTVAKPGVPEPVVVDVRP